jgi:hypothetical protein
MSRAEQALPDDDSGAESCSAGRRPAAVPGSQFVEETIRALIDLDAEHLEALAAAADQFRQDAVVRLAPAEIAEIEAKMRLLSALLAETRRNLRVFAAAMGAPDSLGYKPGRRPWVD